MSIRIFAAFSVTLLAAFGQAASAQAPSKMMILAQAQDRCMTTHAVRQTRTSTDDRAIYEFARTECEGLQQQLDASIDLELPAEQAKAVKEQMRAQSKPNFLSLVAKIRSDRAERGE